MLKLYYSVIFITGLCSLSYQVIWQRYLSILVGAEARSSTLVVSIFLFGLASGYYYFGKLTEKIKSRHELLKRYGLIELVTGLFIILFPTIFNLLFNSPLGHINNFFVHFLLTMILCFLPAFLMGATVPIMTKVLPSREEEINKSHAQIYGINTLGAFLGVLISGLYMIPEFGLSLSLTLFGILNFLVSFIYIGNHLEGEIIKSPETTDLKTNFKSFELYALGFIAGLVSLALEILWFRLFSFVIGSSFIVFPIILSLFILGIGVGSLTLKEQSEAGFKKTLLLSCLFSAFLFVLSPLIPLIISHLRVSIVSRMGTFWFYHGILFLLMGIFIVPGVFYLGRLLPYSYSMLSKDSENYGMKCGWMYFFNTLGAVLGSVVIGYFFFYLFNLETIYRFLLIVLFITSLHFLFKLKDKLYLGGVFILLVVVILVPYPRKNMWEGLFRTRELSTVHQKGLIEETYKVKSQTEFLFKKDGPNSSVAAGVFDYDGVSGKYILVNGKSDSHTVGDLPTLTLLGLIPYYLFNEKELNTSLIGIGTGLTAGILSTIDEVKKLDVIEISPAVIDSIKHFSPENYDFDKSSKVKIHEMDAFQFFKDMPDSSYHFVVSEPTNPWINGVENLYTPYFYELVKKKLRSNGVFVQWIHSYSMDEKILSSILKNMNASFPFMKVFKLKGDLVVVGAQDLNKLELIEKKGNAQIDKVFEDLGFSSFKDINFLEALSAREVKAYVNTVDSYPHDLFFPGIGYYAYKNMYAGKDVKIELILNSSFIRVIQGEEDLDRKAGLLEAMKRAECASKNGNKFFCKYFLNHLQGKYRELASDNISKSLNAYGYLRRMRFLSFDQSFFDKKIKEILEGKKLFQESNLLLIEYLKEGRLSEAKELLEVFIKNGLIPTKNREIILKKMENTRALQNQVLGIYR